MSDAPSSNAPSGDALGTWVDGVAGNLVPADDRGLQYGDGVFETILVRNGTPRFLDLHRQRLARGMERLHFPVLGNEVLDADIARALALAPPSAVLKIIITRGSSPQRGYAPSNDCAARRIVSLWPNAPLAQGIIDEGAVLGVCDLRLPQPSPLAGLKHLNRLENVLAAMERAAGTAYELLLLDTAERLVCGSACNVFLVKNGEILTPGVDRAGVAGVMRAVVLREAARLGIRALERDLSLDDVIAADGVFITNARIGVVPVQRVREHVFGMTEIAVRLRNAIEPLDA